MQTNKPSPRGTWGQTPVRRATEKRLMESNKQYENSMHEMRLQLKAGSQKISTASQRMNQVNITTMAMGCVSIWELPTRLNTWYRMQNTAQPAVAQLMRYNNTIQASHNSNEAYTAASNITHAQSKAIKQAHIRTSILLSYNYNNEVPSNTDLKPTKQNTTLTQGPKAHTTNWELRAQPNLSYPSNTTEGSKQSKRLQKGDVFAHLSSFTQAFKSSTKRSVLARGVQRYHSYFSRSYLSSAIGEDKVR
ncbi:hypothetical protein F511_38831 [Dorcoceras hygrometricum]|uniref:Uncharacterized protein n=1 Tax=Dorcoceras hygrometricum TaxID=472368 RepID=A0A2Z7BZK9_9LAMI|nr:hypothetical protein F511_38831 [Dorcoceras hygrometricum]